MHGGKSNATARQTPRSQLLHAQNLPGAGRSNYRLCFSIYWPTHPKNVGEPLTLLHINPTDRLTPP